MTVTQPGAAHVAPGATRRAPRTPASTGLTAAQLNTARSMSEDELKTNVIDACRALGLIVAHFRPAKVTRNGRVTYETPIDADGKGFPDLVISGGRHVLWRELKSYSGRPSDEQLRWLRSLAGSGGDSDVWGPVDWMSGRVLGELRAVVL